MWQDQARAEMAFDEELAHRVREALNEAPDITERRMFGGLAFMSAGHMTCGIVSDDLMLRLGEDAAEAALEAPHVRPMDFTGRPMRGMVYVAAPALTSDADLAEWIGRALRYTRSLPPKT